MFSHKLLSLIAVTCLGFSLMACDSPEQKEAKYLSRGDKLFEQKEFSKARLEYKNAARIAPTDPVVRYKLGLADEAENDIQNAFANFMAAEQQNAQFEPALFKLSQYFLAAGHYEETRKRIDILLSKNPQNADAHALRAALLLRLKDLSTAEKEVQLAFQIDPNNLIGFSVSSGLYVAQNNLGKALSVLEDGIKRNPQELSLLFLKAAVYDKKGDVDKIAETYQSVFNLRPQTIAYRFNLADIFIAVKRLDDAEKTLRTAVSLFPDNWPAKHKLVFFLGENRDLQTAEKEVRAFMTAHPDQSDFYFWLADLYIQHKASAQAIALLEELIAKDENEKTSLNARTSLAHIRLLQGNKDMADKLLDVVFQKNTNNPEGLFIRATLSYQRGDTQRAVSDLRTILRDKPKSERALELLAETYLNQNRVDLAIDTLNQLLSFNPTSHKNRVRLAQMYGQQKDFKQAIKMVTIVTKSDPSYPVGWESTARLAIKAQNWPLAEEAIQKLNDSEGQSMTALFLKAQMLDATQKQEASLSLYKRIIDNDPSSPLSEHALSALIKAAQNVGKLDEISSYIATLKTESGVVASLLGETYMATGKDKEAAEAFDLAIKRKANFQAPYIYRAQLYIKEKRIDQALSVLREAEQLFSADAQASFMMADLLTAQMKIDEAVALYSALLERNPAFDIAANNLAQLIADHQSNNPAALEKARKAAERFSSSATPEFLDTLGWVYYRQGNLPQALVYLERANSASPNVHPQISYHYGSLLLKLGKKEEARANLLKATVTGAVYTGVDEAQKRLVESK